MSVALADHRDHCPRNVAHDRTSGFDIEIDRQRNSIVMTVRAPPECKRALGRRLLEGGLGDEIVVFEVRRRPRHHPPRKDDRRVILAGSAGTGDQGVLAGAARSDYQHQATRTDQIRAPQHAENRCHQTHATRRPSRHTLRTAGTSPATRSVAARTATSAGRPCSVRKKQDAAPFPCARYSPAAQCGQT